MKFPLRIACFIILAALSMSSASACDETDGARYVQRGELDSAYSLLKGCEHKADVSPETLIYMAIIYGSMDFENLGDDEALVRIWSLIHNAASRGHYDSLKAVAHLYRNGEPRLSIRPDEKRASCIEEAALSTNIVAQKSVERCLGKR